MSWILQIDTALETASVSVSNQGALVAERKNSLQKDHAAFLHNAVKELLAEAGINLQNLQAVSVIAGPGSYTGLRVGFAAAKGFCFALQIPLITIGTLEYMAASALEQLRENNNYGTMLVCPMIDARRMEVYTALYNNKLEIEEAARAVVLEKDFMNDRLENDLIYFFGTGCAKWKDIYEGGNAFFLAIDNNPLVLSNLTYERFQQGRFEDVAYCEPSYLKEFYFNKL